MQSLSPRLKGRIFTPLFLFAAVGLMIAALVGSARPAQALVDSQEYTEAEKVGFAFYQLSGAKPDFKRWVKKTDAYKNALPVEKVEMMQKELARLDRGMGLYHPDEDLVTLEMDVNVNRLPDATADPENIKHALQVEFTGDKGSHYIPIEIGDVWIAVIMQDLEKHSFRIYNTKEFENVLQKLGSNIGATNKKLLGHVKIMVRPVSVSNDQPAIVGDIELWPMLAEIASFSLWNRDGTVFIWDYEAPWYVSGERKGLVDLYKD